ncbi:hypothetical protein FEM01_14865 [Pseudomonas mosselii]|uniref:Uncharacterized protein n=1 Tax=Pseudomonas mosselii TaxID=78327 RepID=A0A5R8Z209_9PSED|nr:hypothetical protein FEM01_14865 [Pseudomonas mosselii]
MRALYPVGAALAAKQATRRMAPAVPVFAAKAAPTGWRNTRIKRSPFRHARHSSKPIPTGARRF